MSGLVLKLRANEEIIVNGVLMCNGSRSTRLLVKTPGAKILRLSEALDPVEVTTPLAELCLLAQRTVSGEVAEEDGLPRLADGVTELIEQMPGDECRVTLERALDALRDRQFYIAFRALKKLWKSQSDPYGRSDKASSSSSSMGSAEAIR
ncbi:MAG: flagellar biosynthesis repressor FlbT [Pseudomonadota bacterium]